jgi:hypothetical protein
VIHETFFSLATVSLRLNSLKLKGSIYYFNNNIWYKYTSITWQKDKYLMADNKLRIPRKLKTETHKQLKIRTDMNSDAPYGSAVRTSLIPLHGWKSWGQLPSLLLKIEGGGQNSFAPLFGITFKKKTVLL